MKDIVVLTVLFLFLCIVISACNQEPPLPESDRLAYKISGRIAEQLKNKYDLDLNGVGLSGSGDEQKLKEIMLSFSLIHLVTKEEGRDLILQCIGESLHEINNYEEIKPYLVQNPFTYRNIEFVILFYSDAKYADTLDPNIWSISLVDGIINYKIANVQNSFTNKSWEKESYDDALKIQNRLN